MNNSALLLCASAGVSASIEDAFRRSGYLVETVSSADKAVDKFRSHSPGIIISELSDEIDGLSLLKRIRTTDRYTPFLILNLISDDKSTIDSLEAGANDCVRMPCSIAEILVRSGHMINSPLTLKPSWKKIGSYYFEPVANTLSINGKKTLLTGRESGILEILSKCINRTVNTSDILDALWEDSDYFAGRSLSVHMTMLRKKLSGDPNLDIINERGVGYRLVDMGLLNDVSNS